MRRKINPLVEIMARSKEALGPKPQTEKLQAVLERILRELVDEIMANCGNSRLEFDYQPREIALEIRRRQTVFESRKWKLYFEKWGCRMYSQKAVLHARCGCCENCNGLVTKRLFQIKRDYEEVDHDREIERRIDNLTSRARTAQQLLGQGEK